MVAEAEKFAAEVRLPSPLRQGNHEQTFLQDELQRKRIETLNSLSSVVYGIKSSLNDQDGFGGKMSDEDRKTLLVTVKDAGGWIDENGTSASIEDLEEKLAGNILSTLCATVSCY